jgi:hypothetical protein
LDEIRFDHVFERIARFGQRSREGFHPHRAAAMMFGHTAQIAAIHGVQAQRIDFQAQQGSIGDIPVDHGLALYAGKIAHAAQQPASDARRAARPAGDLDGAVAGERKMQFFGAARDNQGQFLRRVEDKTQRDAEPVAQGGRQQPGARGGANQRERLQIDPYRARGGTFADDQVELEILHRGVENFLDRGLQAMDLVDEQYVTWLQIGEDGRQVPCPLDHWPRSGPEPHAELARHNLRQRGLAQAGRPMQQHVIERLGAGAGGLDEHRQVFAARLLAHEFAQRLRP